MDDLLEKRRVGRILFTKAWKVVWNHLEQIKDVTNDEDRECKLHAAEVAADLMKPKFEDLQMATDALYYHKDYEAWWNDLTTSQQEEEERKEEEYCDTYTTIWARLQQEQDKRGKLVSSVKEEGDNSMTSEASMAPTKFVECLKEAFSTMNSGITADQLKDIMSVSKRKNVNIQKFKGEDEYFDIWKGMVEGEIEKPGWSGEQEKAYYILSLLEGTPKKECAGLKDPSAADILSYLDAKYGNTKLKLEQACAEIASVKEITTSSKDLDAAYTKLLAAWNFILKKHPNEETLKKESWVFTALVKPKVSRELLREWESKDETKADFPEPFDDFLKKLYEAYQLSVRTEKRKGLSKEGKDKDKLQSIESALALLSQQQRQSDQDRAKGGGERCSYCNGSNHSVVNCFRLKKLPLGERREFVKTKNLCYKCLSGQHLSFNCQAQCQLCHGKHHELCCTKNEGPKKDKKPEEQKPPVIPKKDDKRPEDKKNGTQSRNQDPKEQGEGNATFVAPSQTMTSILPIVQVKVERNDAKLELCNVLFDSGSDRSYISSKMVRKIRPKWVKTEKIGFSSFGGTTAKSTSRNVFKIDMMTQEEKKIEVRVLEIETICQEVNRSPVPMDLIPPELADTRQGMKRLEIDILIGLDRYWTLMKPEIQPKIINESLGIQESLFGPVISGCAVRSPNTTGTTQLLNIAEIPDSIINSFWSLEPLGIVATEQDYVLENFEKSIKYCEEEQRYEVRLPWKLDKSLKLDDNYRKVFAHLQRLSKKLKANPKLAKEYAKYFAVLEDEGMITEVKDNGPSGVVVYLTHRPVVRESSTSTKVRPVFNASLPAGSGLSLNDCLEQGPNLLPKIYPILIRYRRWKVAVNSDVTKAFLQIKIAKEDQDAMRFLLEKDGQVIRKMRFTRVPFGLTSSPFLLNATIKHHLALQPKTRVREELEENLYVDDWITGADTVEEAKKMHHEADHIMKKAGMTLAKWNSSHDIFETKDASREEYSKVLGLSWDPKNDCFIFEGIELPEDPVITKSFILSCIARVYDPLGFVTPFMITSKILFQTLWKKGLAWNEKVPEEIEEKFKRWLEELQDLKRLKIRRQFGAGLNLPWNISDVELKVYADASPMAYGCAAYVVIKEEKGQVLTSRLVMSVTRVAPLKTVTIPRLELMACLVAAKCLRYVSDSLKLDRPRYNCYTDSMIALSWIRGPTTKTPVFVKNRVEQIRELVDPARFYHIVGEKNPADLLTRGLTAKQLMSSRLWFHGPCDDNTNVDVDMTEKFEEEPGNEEEVMLVNQPIERDFDVTRYGKLNHAVRVFGWMLRISEIARLRRQPQPSPVPEDLTQTELKAALMKLIKMEQHRSFAQEIDDLQKKKEVNRGSKLLTLKPVLSEDGLLRKGTRLDEIQLHYSAKYPIIVPKGHLGKLLLRMIHLVTAHAGVETMINDSRNGFWIIGARVLAKQVKKECLDCIRQDSRPFNVENAPLPKVRIQEAPPFSICGIDYGGPLYCIDNPGEKFYICLFTCGVMRAVHCELTPSLTTEEFILAFRRMAGRRGLPTVIYTDNAATFKAAEKVLVEYLGPTAPEWRFIAPLSPWWGGWWERLMRNVKTGLRKTIGKKCLTRSELETSLIEVEAMVNSRPLTFVGDGPDNSRALTPNDFLLGRKGGLEANVEEVEVTTELLSEREIERLNQMKKCWDVWSAEYIKTLPVCVPGAKNVGRIELGQLVMIRDDIKRPRLKWPTGLVVKLHKGKDGLVRAADVKTPSGVKTRDIRRLYNLEVCSDVVRDDRDEVQSKDNSDVESEDNIEQAQHQADDASEAVDENTDSDEGSDDDDVADDEVDEQLKLTRRGRISRAPVKLDL